MGRARKSAADWREFRSEIIAAIDVQHEAAALGIRFAPNATPSPAGWLPCHAIGRPDRSPSAGVNVGDGPLRGCYHDFGATSSSSASMNFFALAAHLKGTTWSDELKHFATLAGLSKRLPKGKSREASLPDDLVKIIPWSPSAIAGLLEAKKGFTAEAIRMTGGELALYPRESSTRQQVVAWPFFGDGGWESEKHGYAGLDALGRGIRIFAGEGQPPKVTTKATVLAGDHGLSGSHGLRLLAEGKAKWVWKVEGYTDLVAVQAAILRDIPKDQWDDHAVVTASEGANCGRTLARTVGLFSDLHVVVVPDRDQPGIDGAHEWVETLRGIAASVRLVELPYPSTDTHGKDARDFINDRGVGSFRDLFDLALRTEPAAADRRPLDDPGAVEDRSMLRFRSILTRVGVTVLGLLEDNAVACFSNPKGAVFEVPGAWLANWPAEALVSQVGPGVLDQLDLGGDGGKPDPSRINMRDVRMAIAACASHRKLSRGNSIEAGIWSLGGKTVLVGGGKVTTVNGSVEQSVVPMIEERMIDAGGDAWFDHVQLEKDLLCARSANWRGEVVGELKKLFGLWHNWKFSDSPDLMAGLVISAWVQSTWTWRPTVVVSGERSTGKSKLMGGEKSVLGVLFGKLGITLAKPRLAAILGAVRRSSRVLILDEFEKDRHRHEILEMLRLSGQGAKTAKGTRGQGVNQYGLEHIVFLGAKLIGMDDTADLSRSIFMDLEQIPAGSRRSLNTDVQWEGLRRLGEKSMAVAIHCWRQATSMAVRVATRSFAVEGRTVENYACPYAMLAAALGHDDDWCAARIEESVRVRSLTGSDEDTDASNVVDDILQSKVRAGAVEYPVGALLLAKSYSLEGTKQTPDELLEGVGIRRVGPPDGSHTPNEWNDSPEATHVFFHPRMIVRHLLHGSEYRFSEGNVRQALARIDGASQSDRSTLSGRRVRGVRIPIASLVCCDGGEQNGPVWGQEGDRGEQNRRFVLPEGGSGTTNVGSGRTEFGDLMDFVGENNDA